MKIFLALLLLVATSWNATPPCYKDLEVNFFNATYVMQAFDLYTQHRVYQSQWAILVRYLQTAEQDVPRLIKEKTRGMRPSPLDYPFQKEQAEQLLLETLYQVFSDVMTRYAQIDNEETIKGMFNYIKDKQQKRLDACLGEKSSGR